MERNTQTIKDFTLQTVKADKYYGDSADTQELYSAIESDTPLDRTQKSLLEDILTDSAQTESAKLTNAASLLAEIDALSIYSDAWGLYIMN
ncbi:hypothetical protein D3C71_964130 [compost metagenome]